MHVLVTEVVKRINNKKSLYITIFKKKPEIFRTHVMEIEPTTRTTGLKTCWKEVESKTNVNNLNK